MHYKKLLLDTFQEMVEEETPKELDCLDVVWLEEGKHSRWSVAATFNRRLAVFRLLSSFFPERFRRMRFRRVPKEGVKWVHADGKPYLSTRVFGVYAEISHHHQIFVGKALRPSGDDPKGIMWEEAWQRAQAIKAKRGS